MEQEKDYSLLRPFDLDAAEWGEPILFGGQYEAVSFVCRSLSGKTNIIEYSGMNTGIVDRVRYASDELLRMAPLCWVEGRPVYKGDVLYFKDTKGAFQRFEGLCSGDSDTIWSNSGFIQPNALTWTPPNVKREVKLLAYIGAHGQLFWRKETATPKFPATRVPTEDRIVVVEE